MRAIIHVKWVAVGVKCSCDVCNGIWCRIFDESDQ